MAEVAKSAAASRASAVALRSAWQFLIPSFGLTLLYLNVHFLARYLGNSQRFSEFGAEWSPQRMMSGKPNMGVKYAEVIALFFLDMLALLVVLAAATLLAMVAYALTHPCEFVGKIGYVAAVTIAALGGPAAQTGVAACVVVNAVAG